MAHAETTAPEGATKLLNAEMAFSRRFFECLDTPISLGRYLRLKYAEEDPTLWVDMVNAEIRIDDYLEKDVDKFADDYAAISLLRKSPNLPTSVDRKQVALNKFFEAEDACRQSNERLHRTLSAGGVFPTPFAKAFVRNVRRIMGDLDEHVLAKISSGCRFGSGKSVGMDTSCGKTRKGQTKRGITQSGKFRNPLTVTKELLPFAEALIGDRHDVIVVEGEEFTSVSKDAKTERGIAPQPTVNGYLQNSIGDHLRERLLLFGFDIRDQSLNQLLARFAKLLGLSTIDLSMASDLICRELIRWACSSRWYHLLMLASCRRVTVKSKGGIPMTIQLERFSSMGNGFTFPLETIIFGALLWAVVPKAEWPMVNAYGDDLICPQKYYPSVVEGLEFLGFQVNSRKSYRGGNFFESCGTDWFCGTNVRPIFLDRDTAFHEGIPYHLQMANALRSYAKRRGILGCCDKRFEKVWQWAVDRVPKLWSHRVPPSMGDVGIMTEKPEGLVKVSAPAPDGKPSGGVPWLFPVKHVNVPSRVSALLDEATVHAKLAAMETRPESNELMRLVDEIHQSLEDIGFSGYIHDDGLEFVDVIRNTYGRPHTKTSYVPTWDSGWDWL
mgnify:FL=1